MIKSDFLLRAISAGFLLLLSGLANALLLQPQYAGTYLNGDGANSQWVQINADWRGATYGAEPWGTGVWGLADQTAILGLPAADPDVVQTLSRQVDQINFGDQAFIDAWGSAWDTPQLAPIFDNAPGENQDNWVSRFTGYLSIVTPGDYNLAVLYDDGFRFLLSGADGLSVSLQQDGLNPRDRLGFSENLQLSAGLYAYQLDAYERLEAGVVQLAWWTPDTDRALVPRESLFTHAIPEPATLLLTLTGLAFLSARLRKRG